MSAYVVTAVVAGLIGTVVLAVSDRGAGWAYGIATVVVGVGLMLTGGTLLPRATTLDSSRWGVDTGRHRRTSVATTPTPGR